MSDLDDLKEAMDASQVELESRLAYQEQALNELSDTLYQQQKELEKLHTMVKHLSEQLRSLNDGGGAVAESHLDNQPPPHY